jgi:hypothetical protein
MLSNNSCTIVLYTISKFIFTIFIGLIFWSYDIPSGGEDKNYNNTILYDQIDNHINNQTTNNTIQKNNLPHNSAIYTATIMTWQKQNYDILCNQLPALCQTIQDTILPPDHKYAILSLSVLRDINNILSTIYPPLSQWLDSIVIKNDTSKKRWYANHHAIVINTYQITDDEYIQVLTHELWHIIDLWILQGDNTTKSKKFTEFWKEVFDSNDISLIYYTLSRDSEKSRNLQSQKVDFCSIYAMTNPFEDLAECINLYLHHHRYFQTIKNSSNILEKKYNFISQLFDGKYIHDKTTDWLSNDNNFRYRDSTKMGEK